jgi:ElaB/YqjD/DUF883 family membrane-anchored ribosome-binding protein
MSEDTGRAGTNTQGTAKKPAEQIQESVEKAAENVQQTVNKAKDSVQQAVNQVGTEAQKAAENVQHSVAQASTDASRNMREAAYNVKETASTSLLNAAESIRREAVKGGNEDVVRQAHKLARSMEKAAVYLDSHTFEQIGTDAAETVRENPWQALGLAFIVGLILGLLASGNRD